MALGGKTGGRKRGTPNKTQGKKRTLLRHTVEVTGKTPLEVMLEVMENPHAVTEVQFEAAKAAAPYVHARKVHAEIDHSFDRVIDRLERGRQRAKAIGDGNDKGPSEGP